MKHILLLLVVVFTSLQIQAQRKEITGTITDEDNLPLPGVNVVVKGIEGGTTTDFDGNYSIMAKVDDILIFSYVGYIEERIIIEELKTISFALIVPFESQKFITTNCGYYRGRFAPQITYQYDIIKFR